MEETLEYWQQKLAEFKEAIESEHEMELQNIDMIFLLKRNIDYCESKIKELTS